MLHLQFTLETGHDNSLGYDFSKKLHSGTTIITLKLLMIPYLVTFTPPPKWRKNELIVDNVNISFFDGSPKSTMAMTFQA